MKNSLLLSVAASVLLASAGVSAAWRWLGRRKGGEEKVIDRVAQWGISVVIDEMPRVTGLSIVLDPTAGVTVSASIVSAASLLTSLSSSVAAALASAIPIWLSAGDAVLSGDAPRVAAGSLMAWMNRFRMKICTTTCTVLFEARFSVTGVSYFIAVLVLGGPTQEPDILMLEPSAQVLDGTIRVEVSPLNLSIGNMGIPIGVQDRHHIVFAPLPASVEDLSFSISMLFRVVALPDEETIGDYEFKPISVAAVLLVDEPFQVNNSYAVQILGGEPNPVGYFAVVVQAAQAGRLVRPVTRRMPDKSFTLQITCPVECLVRTLAEEEAALWW